MKRLLGIVDTVTRVWIFVGLAVMFVIIVFDVMMRSVFNSPLPWPQEMAQFAVIHVTYIGAAVAFRGAHHISINVVTARLSQRNQERIVVINQFILLPFLLVLLWSTWNILHETMGSTPVLRLPMWMYYFPVFAGSAAIVFYAVAEIWEKIGVFTGRGVERGQDGTA